MHGPMGLLECRIQLELRTNLPAHQGTNSLLSPVLIQLLDQKREMASGISFFFKITFSANAKRVDSSVFLLEKKTRVLTF